MTFDLLSKMASDDNMRDLLGCSTDLFTLLGVACAACLSYKYISSSLNGIKVFFLSRSLGLSANLKEMGSWAVVTGSTDGIGKAYAEQLAELGLNIVLISRSLDKLQNVAQGIESAFKVKTKYIVADFSVGEEIYPSIKSGLDGLDIGVLVNNVGTSYGRPSKILDLENVDKKTLDIINVNMTSACMMTNIVLPAMVEKKKGTIINISSQAGLRPVPYITIYSASKAFVDFYSTCLQEEYRSKGVIIQCVMPGIVTTKMSGFRRTHVGIPSTTNYVGSALATVGLQTRTAGYWTHALIGVLIQKVPEWIYFRAASALPALAAIRDKNDRAKLNNE